MAVTAGGGFLISELDGHRVRRVGADGHIATVAGTSVAGYSGDGGDATCAKLNQPQKVAVTGDGGFLIADSANHRIRRVSPNGVISTVAGTGTAGPRRRQPGDVGAAQQAARRRDQRRGRPADRRHVQPPHPRRRRRRSATATAAAPTAAAGAARGADRAADGEPQPDLHRRPHANRRERHDSGVGADRAHVDLLLAALQPPELERVERRNWNVHYGGPVTSVTYTFSWNWVKKIRGWVGEEYATREDVVMRLEVQDAYGLKDETQVPVSFVQKSAIESRRGCPLGSAPAPTSDFRVPAKVFKRLENTSSSWGLSLPCKSPYPCIGSITAHAKTQDLGQRPGLGQPQRRARLRGPRLGPAADDGEAARQADPHRQPAAQAPQAPEGERRRQPVHADRQAGHD